MRHKSPKTSSRTPVSVTFLGHVTLSLSVAAMALGSAGT